ncbi:uncharacterized protein [Triticum aestivum]|uniref:uncharacterized protein n=1 Tax=Triticum aestivum TaxID=4565 RepID=UPI001D014AC7|nr:uncharacterized protein LOC123099275 [Triticum aestivum]
MAPPAVGHRDMPYIHVDVCRRYWETATPLPWGDVHLPNNWHLSADREPIPPVPVGGCGRCVEVNRRRARLPPDLLEDPRYAIDSPMWDTWPRDKHDQRRQSFFADRPPSPRCPRPPHADTPPKTRGLRARGIRPTPSPSPSPPPSPPMTEEEEARLIRRVMEDSMSTHDERQWDGLESALALSTTGDVAILELELDVKEEVQEEIVEEPSVTVWNPCLVGQWWSWSCTVPEMADSVGIGPWSAKPQQSP